MKRQRERTASAVLVVCLAGACGPAREAQAPSEGDRQSASAPTQPKASKPAKPEASSNAPSADTPQPPKTERRLWVDSVRVDCVGSSPRKCLRVKDAEDAEWSLFYSDIEGFEYEEGFLYELRVDVTPVESPPADVASLRFELVEVVSKEPATAGSP